ncbi:MAG: Uma2 family endonuclease [Planctomycetes bacterium]|nr:Uma2 family endonuclease [Planctomycetota bacterium]
MGDIGRCELIQGELLRMSPGGFEHGTVAMEIGSYLADHVRRHKLGIVTAAETGFRIARNPDTVRAPDAAFVAAARVSAIPRRGFFEGAPDLAVEVVSPDDRWSEVTAKVTGWLQAGAKMVWVVDPPNRTIAVYAASADVRILREQDTLDGGDIIPGLRIPVRDVFSGLPMH